MAGQRSNAPVMHFFGVRTEGSSALKLFPHWAGALGLDDARLVGVDLPLDTSAATYREAVRAIKEDPRVAGALVTSHKLNVVRAAGDLFDGFTDDAERCGEVSAIYKRDGKLWGHACDPVGSGRAMAHFLGDGYWQQHPEAALLSFGAGGAAVAVVVYFLAHARFRPKIIHLVDIDARQLDHVRAIIDQYPDCEVQFALIHNADAAVNDRLMADLPPRSLVVNATGMGKDLPGSPVTEAGVFPQDGAAWELNYRGERLFLQQAQRQAATRSLCVEDGWYFFLIGWSTVMSYVFDVAITPERFERFAAASERAR